MVDTPRFLSALLGLFADNTTKDIDAPDVRDMLVSIMPTGRSVTMTVAGSNLSTAEKVRADYVCDGTADEAEFVSAIAALGVQGGIVVGLPGSVFNTTGIIEVTANSRVVVSLYGTKVVPGAGVTALGIRQGCGGDVLGAGIVGAWVEPATLNGQIGARLRDTDRGMLKDIRVKGCAVGIALDSFAAGAWCEASVLEDIIVTDCTTGLKITMTSGTGSFGETIVRNLALNNNTTDIDLGAGCTLYRSDWSGVTIWQHINQTGWSLNGDIHGMRAHIGFENLDTPTTTGVVGIALGTGATNTMAADLHFDWSGSFASKVSDPNSKYLGWHEGRISYMNHVDAGAHIDTRVPGDVMGRVQFLANAAGGGGIGLGNGAGVLFYMVAEAQDLARLTGGFEMPEITAPSAPGANSLRLFVQDSGGKTQLVAKFNTSTAVIATQDQALPALAAWPIGSVYTSIVSTDPGTIFGGTWAAFGAGRVLVGRDSGDVDFDTAEETGGAKTITLTEAQMPVHTHIQNAHSHVERQNNVITGGLAGWNAIPDTSTNTAIDTGYSTQTTVAVNQNAGSGTAHSNVQPYIVVYFFKRTA